MAQVDLEDLFADNEEARDWSDQCMEWLLQDSGHRSALDRVVRLEPPGESSWSLLLAERLIETSLSPSIPDEMERHATPEIQPATERVSQLLRHLAQWMLALLQKAGVEQDLATELSCAEKVGRLYPLVHARNLVHAEGPWLQLLAWNRQSKPLQLLVEFLVELPPHDWSGTAIAVSPLIRSTDWQVELVFPRLLDGVKHATAISTILDLANFVSRKKMAAEHPALGIRDNLTSLLGAVVGRLGVLEDEPSRFGQSVAEIQHILGESVALCVALCDALGWIGGEGAVGKLNQAASLTHRRVQTEAAAALARLGSESGKTQLVALAAQPIARLRVLAYAAELDLMDKIDPQFMTPLAQAEAELVLWLSQPQQMGLPPTAIELISQSTLHWPGYDSPQECYLFRYSYQFPSGELDGIGIAGPLLHSFAADLADLPEDDIYAAFAGWHAEHDDIYEVERGLFNPAQIAEAKKLSRHLEEHQHESIETVMLGFFLGERACVAHTQLNQTAGIAATDGLEILWIPTQGRIRPLGPQEVYCIFKGRKIIRTFNP